ncbi:ubiquitin ligase [Cryptosporidium canis]|uniref:Ubiquitin ligase n=1 Tax=Cryptosporidium canis TaxID=195482 RepID=A0A9D5HUJ7_9CRYT|nr:ubiquitin ligase [Cryptosporidium canis]
MSVRRGDLDRIVRERCEYPVEIFSELRLLDVSPSEMAERYILWGVGQLSGVGSKEARREFVSRMVLSSIRRARGPAERGVGAGAGEDGSKCGGEASGLRMDPLGGFSDEFREWLKESLVRHFGGMVECEREVISGLAEQMNQFLSVSRASSMEGAANMKRISEVLLEENVIVRSENKGLYETGRLSNAEVIKFPAALLKLRDSVLGLVGAGDSGRTDGDELEDLGTGGRFSRGLMMDQEQERDIYFGRSLGGVGLERRYGLLLRDDSNSELRSAIQDLGDFLGGRLHPAKMGWKRRVQQSSRLSSKFSSILGLISREYFNLEQTNLILDLCLRLVVKLENMSFLLEVLRELSRLRRQIGDQLVLEMDPLVWSKLQILALAPSFDLLVYDGGESLRRVSNSWRDEQEVLGLPFSRHVVFENVPLFGCNIIQFHLISDSRVFNEVIQENRVRSRIEISLEPTDPEGLSETRSKNPTKQIPSLRKFDTRTRGGRETRPLGSVLTLEFCDNTINIYESRADLCSGRAGVSARSGSNSAYPPGGGGGGWTEEARLTRQLERSFMGDYLVELATYIEISGEKTIQSCLSVLVNGEIVHTLKFGREMFSDLKIQVTMIEEIFLELQSSENLSRRLVEDILLRNGILDQLEMDAPQSKEDLGSPRVRVSIGSLLIFLSSIWRTRINKDPRAVLELHSSHHLSWRGLGGSDDLSRGAPGLGRQAQHPAGAESRPHSQAVRVRRGVSAPASSSSGDAGPRPPPQESDHGSCRGVPQSGGLLPDHQQTPESGSGLGAAGVPVDVQDLGHQHAVQDELGRGSDDLPVNFPRGCSQVHQGDHELQPKRDQ